MNQIFIGKTESGKTFEAKKRMLQSSRGALFINYVDKEKDKRFEQTNRHTNLQLICNLLRNGKKVQYNITSDFDKEVIALHHFLVREKWACNFIFCIDELHLLKKRTLNVLSSIWKIGRHDNIYGYGITQRPQDVDRGMITQSKKLVIFKCSIEDSWFKSYGISIDKIPQEVHKYYEHEM